jgi:hypothetical protein
MKIIKARRVIQGRKKSCRFQVEKNLESGIKNLELKVDNLKFSFPFYSGDSRFLIPDSRFSSFLFPL